MKKTSRDFREMLRGAFGLTRQQLYQLPFETRQGVKQVVFDMLSALYTGCASRPQNDDPLSEQ